MPERANVVCERAYRTCPRTLSANVANVTLLARARVGGRFGARSVRFGSVRATGVRHVTRDTSRNGQASRNRRGSFQVSRARDGARKRAGTPREGGGLHGLLGERLTRARRGRAIGRPPSGGAVRVSPGFHPRLHFVPVVPQHPHHRRLTGGPGHFGPRVADRPAGRSRRGTPQRLEFPPPGDVAARGSRRARGATGRARARGFRRRGFGSSCARIGSPSAPAAWWRSSP